MTIFASGEVGQVETKPPQKERMVINMMVRIAGVVPESIVDGPGLRFTIFAQGCPHKCKGCHNPHTHDFKSGSLHDTDRIVEKIRNNPLLDGVTFSGGEPFHQAEAFCKIAEKLRKCRPELSIYCYTGYTFEELLDMGSSDVKNLLSYIDVLIDGRYDENKRSLELKFKGSTNQRMLNAKESVSKGRAVTLV